MAKPTVLVLGDQLTRQVGPLAGAAPGDARVLMVESRALLHGLPHHAQKLVLVLSAMRRCGRWTPSAPSGCAASATSRTPSSWASRSRGTRPCRCR